MLASLLALLVAAPAWAGGITNSADDLRTGWYSDQPGLSPQQVSGGDFGQMWSADVVGQVYAQPLLFHGTVLVATEANRVYGLDPATGNRKWERQFGAPWNPADLSCADLTPEIGVTATPVVDSVTNTAYVTSKTYASGVSGPARWYVHALDVATGDERSGFPIALTGSAQNVPGRTFDPTQQLQRPGLLLLDGVVYAAFGSHCDAPPWQGWIFGVSTDGRITARWVAVADGDGAGIWHSGAGLMSDGPGRIFVGTGNPGAPPGPRAGSAPPANLGESIVRLAVQPDGSLRAADFFAPFDAAILDTWDADFASGGPVGLPDEYFGTAAVPHLAIAVGKQGYVYLLDREHLGGIAMGDNGSDDVVQRIGPYGGVWARPGVWPGDGGYVYIPTASDGFTAGGSSGFLRVYKYGHSGTGKPTLSLEGTSTDGFGFSSSAPVITSDGTTTGSALVWVVWTGTGSGAGAQLRAYDPVPVDGAPVLRWSAPIGTSSKFAIPGVGAGRIFVGTRDGKVLAFGAPVTKPLTGAALDFPGTTVGDSATRTMTLTAHDAVTVSSITSGSADYAVGTPSATLPAALAAGDTLTVPVTFSPRKSGISGATMTIATNTGAVQIPASGTGRAAGPELAVAPPAVSFEGVAVGGHASATATFRNTGSRPVVINGIHVPAPPFGAPDVPAVGSQIAPGDALTVTVTFDPDAAGTFIDGVRLDTNAGVGEVGLSASAGTPGHLVISSENVDFGAVDYGAAAAREFTIANAGETPVTLMKSKPPLGGGFTVATQLPEGTVIGPGKQIVCTVRFSPTAIGPHAAAWQITGNDSTGPHVIHFTGAGAVPSGVSAPREPVPARQPPAPTPKPRGLAGWWSFSEGRGRQVHDSSGNGNTGTITGARWTRAGKKGSALRFDGRRGLVTIPPSRSLRLQRAMTLEAWVRPARAYRGPRTVVAKSGADALHARALPAGRWTHLAATRDGRTLRLYVNGALRSSRRVRGRQVAASGPLRIGGNAFRSDWFSGAIDEVRVYTRALDAAEIAADMRAPQSSPR